MRKREEGRDPQVLAKSQKDKTLTIGIVRRARLSDGILTEEWRD